MTDPLPDPSVTAQDDGNGGVCADASVTEQVSPGVTLNAEVQADTGALDKPSCGGSVGIGISFALALLLSGVLHASTLIYGRTAIWWLSEADYQAAHGNTTTARVFYERALSATAGAKAGSLDDYTRHRAQASLSAMGQ